MNKILRLSLLQIGMLICAHQKLSAQGTTLATGDIEFTGVNATANVINGTPSDKDITFILLKNITSGTKFYITDYGWRSDAAAFQTAVPCGASTGSLTDGIILWTATSDMNYGTQVNIRCEFALTATAGQVTAAEAAYNLNLGNTQYVTVAAGGETIFAYQATTARATPTFLGAICMAAAGYKATLNNCDFDATGSTQPSALSTNNFSYAFGANTSGGSFPNAKLKSTVTIPSDATAARTMLANPSNWDFTSTANVLPGINTTPLPMQLESFDATNAIDKNLLNWRTGTENQISLYNIERSEDGETFKVIGSVTPINKSDSRYSYVDAVNGRPTSYYRLSIIEINGKIEYSGVVKVSSNIEKALTLYPNPSNDFVTVDLGSELNKGQSLSIMDVNGKIVYSSVPTTQTALINLKGIMPGFYTVHYGSQIIKLAKQ